MFKKSLALIAVALLLMVVGTVKTTWAQGGVGITYQTGFQLQNLSASTATVAIAYYNQSGAIVTTVTDSIAANSSKTYFPIAPASPFNGSVVVSSDQQLVAIANQLSGGTLTGGSSTGSFSGGANSINLPLIMRGNSGFSTWFNVQNAGTTVTTVNVTFVPGSSGSASTASASVAPGASATFDQFPNAALGPLFVGSAVVTATQPIVATVEQAGTGSIKALLGYNGFTSASTSVALPLIMAQNSGFFTGVQVQNTSGSAAVITVTYAPNTVAGMGTPVPDVSPSVPAGGSYTFLQNGGQWTARYVGAATVTASASAPIVAIVNQLKIGALSFGSAYEGFNPASAKNKVSAPLIMTNNSGYFTGIQVQNVSGTSPCSVSVTYGPNTASGGGLYTPVTDSDSISTGSSKTFLQNGNDHSNTWGAGKYIGSAVIQGTGCNILAIINELKLTVNDQLFTYDGFNY